MSSAARSHAGQMLAPLASLLWPLFLACTGLVALVWLSGFGAGTLADPDFIRRLPNADLRAALALFSRALDPAWITLGAVNLYLALARAEGLAVARRWCGLVLFVGFVIAAANAKTDLPLGPVHFPANLGWKIGPVPFALPFLWLVIVVGARESVLRAFPKLGHAGCALLTGAGCLLTNFLLEPVAWKYRAWWLWYPARLDAPETVPWTARATWFLAGSLLAFAMRSPSVAPRLSIRPAAPVVAYALLNAVVLLTRLFR